MKKIEAITFLLNGECDAIGKGSSTFIMENDSIVNMRSKKPIDMKTVHESGWGTLRTPRWFDVLEDGGRVLCWTNESKSDMSVIVKMNNDGYFENARGEVIGNDETVFPVSSKEVKNFILDLSKLGKKPVVPQTKEEKTDEKIEESIEIEEGNESGSQKESLESTVTPKEDVGSEVIEENKTDDEQTEGSDTEEWSSEDDINEEIPF